MRKANGHKQQGTPLEDTPEAPDEHQSSLNTSYDSDVTSVSQAASTSATGADESLDSLSTKDKKKKGKGTSLFSKLKFKKPKKNMRPFFDTVDIDE